MILLSSCSQRQGRKTLVQAQIARDTTIIRDAIVDINKNEWQKGFGLTHDPLKDSIWFKPVRFYIDNPKCSPVAIKFYQGKFRPKDDDTSAALLKLVTTEDDKLRPFYRWCLSKTIDIQDGALSEFTGVPARQYAESYPKEFFRYMASDTSLEKYKEWVAAIAYSGVYDKEDYKRSRLIQQHLTSTMKKNCINCSADLQSRIKKFAEDCFP